MPLEYTRYLRFVPKLLLKIHPILRALSLNTFYTASKDFRVKCERVMAGYTKGDISPSVDPHLPIVVNGIPRAYRDHVGFWPLPSRLVCGMSTVIEAAVTAMEMKVVCAHDAEEFLTSRQCMLCMWSHIVQCPGGYSQFRFVFGEPVCETKFGLRQNSDDQSIDNKIHAKVSLLIARMTN